MEHCALDSSSQTVPGRGSTLWRSFWQTEHRKSLTDKSKRLLIFFLDLPWWLLLIRQKALIGKLPGDHEVCKITKIAAIPLSETEPQDLELEV